MKLDENAINNALDFEVSVDIKEWFVYGGDLIPERIAVIKQNKSFIVLTEEQLRDSLMKLYSVPQPRGNMDPITGPSPYCPEFCKDKLSIK